LARDFLEFSAEKISNIGRQRLLAIRKARIWQAFLIEKRKFSKNKNAWAGAGGFEPPHGRIKIPCRLFNESTSNNLAQN
jgi:hypothetical protein